jgi:hypothetical protein
MLQRKFSHLSSLDIAMLKAVSGDKAALKQGQSIKRGFSRMGRSNLYPQSLHQFMRLFQSPGYLHFIKFFLDCAAGESIQIWGVFTDCGCRIFIDVKIQGSGKAYGAKDPHVIFSHNEIGIP